MWEWLALRLWLIFLSFVCVLISFSYLLVRPIFLYVLVLRSCADMSRFYETVLCFRFLWVFFQFLSFRHQIVFRWNRLTFSWCPFWACRFPAFYRWLVNFRCLLSFLWGCRFLRYPCCCHSRFGFWVAVWLFIFFLLLLNIFDWGWVLVFLSFSFVMI